jgi:hypothetical protein
MRIRFVLFDMHKWTLHLILAAPQGILSSDGGRGQCCAGKGVYRFGSRTEGPFCHLDAAFLAFPATLASLAFLPNRSVTGCVMLARNASRGCIVLVVHGSPEMSCEHTMKQYAAVHLI